MTKQSYGAVQHQVKLPPESTLTAAVAILAIILMQLTLLEKLTLGPNWLLPSLELALLVPLTVASPHRKPQQNRFWHLVAIGLIGLINIANFISLGFLVHYLLIGGKTSGGALLFDAGKLWMTNMILFALWFWELDRGGLYQRRQSTKDYPDFLFPQMTSPQFAAKGWQPTFADYLFVSFTNAAAFSPTDTLPLTTRAKMLMLCQALTSLLTIALIAGRAVNILP